MRRTNLFFAKMPRARGRALHRGSGTKGCIAGFAGILRGRFLITLMGLFAATGVLLGALYIRHADYSLLKMLDFVFFSNIQARGTLPLLAVFTASLASSFLFLLFCFLCGLSVWGAYCVPLAPLFRGFGMGLTAGYLYATYGFSGFLFHLLVILPGAFLCLITILLGARESVLFSRKIPLGNKRRAQEEPENNGVRTFFFRFSILTGVLVAGAITDTALAVCIAGFFTF